MVAEKKKCPYCDRVIGRAGWAMHYATKHPERVFVPFDKVGAPAAAVESGDRSFRGGERMERKPRPKKREERREEPDESDEDDDDWGTLLDD